MWAPESYQVGLPLITLLDVAALGSGLMGLSESTQEARRHLSLTLLLSVKLPFKFCEER